MNITILSVGTRGDVQPYVALGAGLRAAGHDVTLATSGHFAGQIAAQGLRPATLSFDAMEMMQTAEGRAALGGKGLLSLIRRLRPTMRQILDEGWQAAQGADLIIYNPKALSGYHLAEKLGVPAIIAHPVPVVAPTAAFPMLALPFGSLGATLNRLSYTLTTAAAQGPFGGLISEWRREALGLPPVKSERLLRGRPIPILYGFSPTIVPPPADWGEHVSVTGYWFLDQPGWQPPADLARFLEVGPPPVYIGFGSMAGRDAARTSAAVLEAVRRAGVRAVLATGVGGLEAAGREGVFVLKEAPHDWLFPRVAAIVHHGGAGTTGAALRAGRPQLICPFFADQPFWGRRVAALGAGPAPIAQKRLSAERLAAALVTLTSDAAMARRAADLGEQIRAEDGVGRAVQLIEAGLTKQPPAAQVAAIS